MKKRLFLAMLALFLASLACQSSNNNNANGSSGRMDDTQEVGPYAGMDEWALGAYQAVLRVEFHGDYEWVYSLTTRSDGIQLEYFMQIFGVDEAQDIGDVLMVTDGRTNWMTGEAANDECFMFPNTLDLGMSFLTPDDLILPAVIAEQLVEDGQARIAGKQAVHYTLEAAALEDWRDLSLEIWLADPSTVLRYELHASGEDPLFDAGEGQLTASYHVENTDEQEITVVQGCQVNLPLPDGISNLVRIPGLVTFETEHTVEEIVDFYLEAMFEAHWFIDNEPVLFEDGSVQMIWHRPERELVIVVKPFGDVTLVELVQR